MKSNAVFIAAATADYSPARSVLQFLTDRGRRCFFCDEALLRAGEAGYLAKVDEALERSAAMVVVAGSRERVDGEWVRFAWRRFGEGGGRRTVTVLSEGMGVEELPRALRRGDCVAFPGELTSLEERLFSPGGESPARRAARPAAGRRTVRLMSAITVLNVLILGMVVWLLVKNGGRFFPQPGEGAASGSQAGGPSGNPPPDAPTRPARTNDTGSAEKTTAASPGNIPEAVPVVANPGGEKAAVQVPFYNANGSPVTLDDAPLAGTPWALNLAGDTRQTFCYIPAGNFIMGSPREESGRDYDEAQRSVEIGQGFWLARTECTAALWRSVMGRQSSTDGDWLPVHSVEWDAVAGAGDSFLVRLNQLHVVPAGWKFVLPTEEQWEYACRAGTTTPFSFGSVLDGRLANCDGTQAYGTREPGPNLAHSTEVGSYPANPWGLYDMHGNVWEWCDRKVRRGGSWKFSAVWCRSAERESEGSVGNDTLGFRLALVRAG